MSQELSSSQLLAKFCSQIDAVPFKYPIQNLKIEGNDLWPILKNYLYKRAIIKSRDPHRDLKSSILYQIYPSPNWIKLFKNKYNAKYFEDISEEKIDFLFFSEQGTIAQQRVNGITYDTIMDGIIVRAQKYGRCKKVMILKQNNQLGEFFITPELLLYPQICYSRTNVLNEDLDDFINFLTNHFQKLDMTRGMILSLLDLFYFEYNSLLILLKKLKPRCIFSYPMVHNHILLNAAKKLSIPVVDVQHGNIENAYVYNHWDEFIFLDKDKFLPDYFLVWNKETGEMIKDLFHESSIVVAGNQWTSYIKKHQDEFKCSRSLQLFLKTYKYIVTIFMTNEPVLDDLIYDIITSYKSSELNIGFVIRPRPNWPIPENIPSVKNCFLTQDVIKIPSYVLIQNSALILTSGSSVLLEADEAGIDTFLFTKESITEHYPQLYREGKVQHIETIYDFYEKFEKTMAKEYIPKFSFGNPDSIDSFLAQFTK